MTNEEAIDVIMDEISCVEHQDSCNHKCGDCGLAMTDSDILEAYNLAIDALVNGEYREEKMVKTETKTDNITGESCKIDVCPTCGSSLGGACFCEYCPWCGQALDWTEVEE